MCTKRSSKCHGHFFAKTRPLFMLSRITGTKCSFEKIGLFLAGMDDMVCTKKIVVCRREVPVVGMCVCEEYIISRSGPPFAL